MAWTNDLPIVRITQHLLELQLRAEKLTLVQRVQALERQATARGLDSTPLKHAAEKLINEPRPLRPDAVDTSLVSPAKPKGVWRKTFLTVRQKPGSVF